MSLHTQQIRLEKYGLYAISYDKTESDYPNCPTLSFLNELNRNHKAEVSKLARLFDYIAQNGPPRNIEKFRKLHSAEEIYEIKTTKVRILCFFDGEKIIICTHGFIKKSQKTPKNELHKAIQTKNAYFHEKDTKY